ncbi:hypothetical protein [Streptosporangium subroseum]|uniref:hypothetical protein n=1 Tax=Streptosporangium subroseum TaxID=106412 RepID=UPI00309013B0|nr:hypothetical protein OHB15_47060 [Streptosporangium subroseum]
MTAEQTEQAEQRAEHEAPISFGPDVEATQPLVTSAAEAPGDDVHPTTDRPAEAEQEQGFPAGQLAAGGVSAAAAMLAGLYQLAGVWGLAAGGAAAGGGALAYVRRRRQGRRTDHRSGITGSGPRRRGADRTGSASSGSVGRIGGGLLGHRRSGARSGFPAGGTARRAGRASIARPGRSSGASSAGAARTGRSFGNPFRSGRAGRTGAGTGSAGARSSSSPRGQRRSGQGRGRTGGSGHGARHTAGRTIRATRRGARQVGGAVRASGRGVRRAGAWADRATGHRASRAFTATGRGARRMGRATGRGVRRVGRTAGRGVRRAGIWADRRTGRRTSTTWAAARTTRGFRAARRAGLAARGGARRWDAEMTAGLVALVAWLTAWWRHRTPEAIPDTTAETAQSAPANDDPAITGSATCPRCGAFHTATIPAGQAGHTITCTCGFTLHFFREDADAGDPPDDTDETPTSQTKTPATDQDQRRHPYTASPTTTRRRTRTMSTFPLAATAAEMNAAAASHAPADMWVVSRELDQLTEVPAYVALAIRTYTQRLQAEYPIDPAVVEAIHRLYQGQAQLVSLAEEIGPLFRRAHADDLKREEAPRTNEPLWNV